MATTTATRTPVLTLGAADYGRISSDPGHDAKGVARQSETSRRLIAAEPSWRYVGSFVDNDLSATKGELRPAFEDLLEAVRRGEVQVVVCYMSGRLFRNRRERAAVTELFADRGVRVVCTDGLDQDYSTPAGRMVAGILGEVDAHEVEQAAVRIRDSKRQAAEEGRPAGARCYGYRPDPLAPKNAKRRLVVPDEAAVLRETRDRLLRGESQGSIIRRLNDAGVKPPYAERWSAPSLRAMMLNPTIAGRRVYHGEDVGKATWDPIISYEDHAKLVGLLGARRTAAPEGWAPRNTYLLSGIAVCGKCGTKLKCRAEYTDGAGRVCPRAYECADKARGGCRGLRRPADGVDDLVEQTILMMLAEPGVVEALLVAGAPDAAEALRVQADIDACRARATRIGEDMAQLEAGDELGKLALRAALDRLRGELDGLRRRQARMARSSVVEGLLERGDLVRFWSAGMTLTQKRGVVAALVEITLLPPGRGRKAGPEHIRIVRRVLA